MELTNQEIQVILEIIDAVSIPVKQSREVVQPIVNKLQMLAVQNQNRQGASSQEEIPANKVD